MDIQYGTLAIMYAGLICALLGVYVGRKKAAKENGNDEMQDHIFKTARSFSWYTTVLTLYVMFTIYGMGIDMNVPAVIGIIMLVHIGTWGISAPVLIYYYSIEKAPNINLIIGILMIVISVILFVVFAIMTGNWLLLLGPIPFNIIGMYFIKDSTNKEKGDN